MNQIAKVASKGDIMESVLLKGDLSKLSPQERSDYYLRVCESVGLNPLTSPLAYITLNGKLTLYALRTCTDQLRSIHKVSVVDLTETERDGVFIVTAKVQNGEGRTDMAKGAVTISNLKGDALANALMKAETKAKRRATLSICGLGLLDETEVETIPGARTEPAPIAPLAIAQPTPGPVADAVTGEVGPRTLVLAENGGAKNWLAFGKAILDGIGTAETPAEVAEWVAANEPALDKMEQEAPKIYGKVRTAIDGHTAAVAKAVNE